MAVLLIAMSVMAILMTVAMPVWKHDATREKETELVFRGEQYGRALALYQRKHGPGTTPQNVQQLLDDHVLRKKYKDPITNDDFDILLQGQQAPGSTTTGTNPGVTGRSGTASSLVSSQQQTGRGGPGGTSANGPVGGIYAFVSKSKDSSIRIYKGRQHYNEWIFAAAQLPQAPGQGAGPGGTVPGVGGPGRGGPGGIPGVGTGRGRPGGPGRGLPDGAGAGGRGVYTVAPNGQVIGPNGQPVVDPRTGQPITLPGAGRGRGGN
jgi:type II secretory pathway pseudopilin PulG